VKKICDFQINAVKSAIFFKIQSTYIAIKPKRDCLVIEFYLENEVNEFPVSRAVRLSKKRVAHEIHLQHPDEINAQIISWLKQSYKLISQNNK
jgi:hypothetical protein